MFSSTPRCRTINHRRKATQPHTSRIAVLESPYQVNGITKISQLKSLILADSFVSPHHTGDIVSKPSWGKSQPNNYNGEQNCVVLDGGQSWLWNDVGCNLDYLHFVCQHPPLSCGSPDVNVNTTIAGRNFTVGASVEYKCPKEHSLVGGAVRKCQSNGAWSGTAPSCKCEYHKID